MKRRILSSVLAAALLGQTAGAFFNDIEDSYTQQAASSLAGMGIVSGTRLGVFEPDRQLTRAEFTKLAVSSMGIANVDNYSSYTIFPDVPAGHWASGWVNAAVRHPELTTGSGEEGSKAQTPLIRGLADGTFGPGNVITLGESCTIVLRMLGYSEDDIGPFWPNDYVAKARALGLLTNLPVTNPSAPLTRAHAAILFRNTLSAQMKDGKSMLSKISGGEPIEHSILVATGDTSPTLTASQATFYEPGGENGEGKLVTRQVVGQIDASVVGSQGVVVFDKELTDHVRGFLPDQSTAREIKAERIDPDGILDGDTGFIEIPRKTPLVALGKVSEYGSAWFDLSEGTQVKLFYDANGVLQMVSEGTEHYNYPIIIIGINGSARDIPEHWDIEKDGVKIRENEIEKYDVITLDHTNKTAIVCSNRLTGVYELGVPSYRYPETITVMGAKFEIPEEFATSFNRFRPMEFITLLFDSYGRICGAVNDESARKPMEGAIIACSDAGQESEASVRLFNGVVVSGKVAPRRVEDEETGEIVDVYGIDNEVVGQQVSVYQNNDLELVLRRLDTYQFKTRDANWDIENRKIGGTPVSPKVQIYERVGGGSPLNPISIYDLPTDFVPADKIYSTRTDSTGTIVSIILTDVSGESWIYGMVEAKAEENTPAMTTTDENGEEVTIPATYNYSVKIETLIGEESKTFEFQLNNDLSRKVKTRQVVGLPVSALKNNTLVTLGVQIPEKVDTVGLEAFTGYEAVNTRNGYFTIVDNVPVYSKRMKKCITLREAKANYGTFELYAEKSAREGGKIRIIVVS